MESVRLAAYLLSPIIPDIASDIYQQLGFPINFNDQTQISIATPFATHATWGILSTNQKLGEPRPVFQRLELLEIV